MTQPWMNTYWTGERAALYKADAQKIPLPDKSVHMVVTSPPYWGLRDYGLGQWQGGDAECEHRNETAHQKQGVTSQRKGRSNIESQRNDNFQQECGHCGAVQQSAGIGLEPTLGEWVEHIVEVMREVRRVLRDDGTVWLNLGDAYSGGGRGTNPNGKQGTNVGTFGLKRESGSGLLPKNLMGQPWRAAFALQDDGWVLRSAITWEKPNPMPEAVLDRPTSSYELVFLLTKSGPPTFWTHQDGHGSRTKPAPDYRMVEGKRVQMWRGRDYFYDAEAIREPSVSGPSDIRKMLEGKERIGGKHKNLVDPLSKASSTTNVGKRRAVGSPGGRNARNVWRIATQGRSDAHFATFPDELARRCIKAGTSERGVCGECGAPWARMVETGYKKNRPSAGNDPRSRSEDKQAEGSMGGHHGWQGNNLLKETQTLGWQPTCGCNAAVVPALVLDPFVGSGTTVAVAQSLGRCGVGLDLNEEYLDIAVKYTTSGKYSWIPKEGSREQTKEMPEQLA